MLAIISYTIFNIKMILKDKVNLIWSVSLPFITLLLNKDSLNSEWQMVYWWVYILIISFINGIGVYVLQLKESGSLRTLFSINDSKVIFFLGNLFTQIIYSIICITLLNITAYFLFDFSFVKLSLISLIALLYCIPLAFLGYNLTLLHKLHVKNISTIFSIIIYGLFFLQNTNSEYNMYNPLIVLAHLIIYQNMLSNLVYFLISLLIIAISFYSIIKFEPISNERR